MRTLVPMIVVLFGVGIAQSLPDQARADVLEVPSEYPTIQDALDAASASDIVRVAPGTYFENLAMRSGVVLESSSGPAVTIIDGAGLGSVIDCIGCSAATTIRGFQLKNGIGTEAFNGRYGGGIRCWQNSDPLIEGNWITANSARFGGGIGCRYNSEPTIRDNRIESNDAIQEGGGVFAIDGTNGVDLLIESNRIESNGAAAGGGIWVGAVDVQVVQNRVRGNAAGPAAGGGIWAGFDGAKVITHNTIDGNTCQSFGGGLYVDDGFGMIERNTFYGNGGPSGGAFATGDRGTQWLRFNILAESTLGAGLYCEGEGDVHVLCNDTWANAGGDGIPDCVFEDQDNFSADPLFCDAVTGDYRLAKSSPCLPEGNVCDELIGAWGQGCEPVPVEIVTWGTLKQRFRR